MKKILASAGLALILAACGSSPAKQAEDEFDIVAKSGSASEKCEAAKKVSAAFLTEKNEKDYSRWKAIADQHCVNASLS